MIHILHVQYDLQCNTHMLFTVNWITAHKETNSVKSYCTRVKHKNINMMINDKKMK